MFGRPAAFACASSLLILAACGGRSDPTEIAPETTTAAPGPGCDDAVTIAENEPITLVGNLGGGSAMGGWCGADDGAEDVYVFTATKNRNVKVRVLAEESEFEPTVRIQQDFCDMGTGLTEVCVGGSKAADGVWPFLAEKDHTYYVIIDSPAGASGEYSVELTWDAASVAECGPHPEVIELVPGGLFQWANTFGRGQGRVDGKCGGPGRENLFKVEVDQPGFLLAEAFSNDGLDPVISFRVGCSGGNERTCSAEPNGDASYAWLEYYVDDVTKNYYLSVDQTGVEGGSYELNVWYEFF